MTSDLASTEPTIATAEDVDCGEVREFRGPSLLDSFRAVLDAPVEALEAVPLTDVFPTTRRTLKPGLSMFGQRLLLDFIGDAGQRFEAASQARRTVPDPGCSR